MKHLQIYAVQLYCYDQNLYVLKYFPIINLLITVQFCTHSKRICKEYIDNERLER